MSAAKTPTPLAGSQRSLRSGSRLLGPVNPAERIAVTIRLRSRNKQPIAADKIGALPPKRRQYLNREKFAAIYGASPADVNKIKLFAKKNKLTVVCVNLDQRNVNLSGPAKALSDAFQVKLMEYEHPDGNYRGRIGGIHLPKELLPIVQGVFGLDNRRMARPHIVKAASSVASHSSSASTFTALQMAELYGFPTDLDGSNECIGILEFGGGYNHDDLVTYFKNLGVAMPSITSVSVDGVKNSPGSDADAEVALDIEVAGAIAPGAKIVVYFAPFTEQGWVDALTTAMHDTVNKPSVLSISWGFAEGEPVQGFEWTAQTVKAVNETLQAAAALGVSVCVASGDDGSSDGINDGLAHVDFPAASPYALGCGGTKLTASKNKIESEVVWNEGPGSGGGGGISAMNPCPAWQAGIVPPSVNPGHYVGRGVPDVCGDADPNTGYQIYYGGQANIVGGTSAVAPLWAALIARINQKLGTPVGYFNPLLYSKLGKAGAFHDIIKGNNDTTGHVGGYSAAKGWDACTGWGSPIGTKLLTGLGG